jgi:hypothetical protein
VVAALPKWLAVDRHLYVEAVTDVGGVVEDDLQLD